MSTFLVAGIQNFAKDLSTGNDVDDLGVINLYKLEGGRGATSNDLFMMDFGDTELKILNTKVKGKPVKIKKGDAEVDASDSAMVKVVGQKAATLLKTLHNLKPNEDFNDLNDFNDLARALENYIGNFKKKGQRLYIRSGSRIKSGDGHENKFLGQLNSLCVTLNKIYPGAVGIKVIEENIGNDFLSRLKKTTSAEKLYDLKNSIKNGLNDLDTNNAMELYTIGGSVPKADYITQLEVLGVFGENLYHDEILKNLYNNNINDGIFYYMVALTRLIAKLENEKKAVGGEDTLFSKISQYADDPGDYCLALGPGGSNASFVFLNKTGYISIEFPKNPLITTGLEGLKDAGRLGLMDERIGYAKSYIDGVIDDMLKSVSKDTKEGEWKGRDVSWTIQSNKVNLSDHFTESAGGGARKNRRSRRGRNRTRRQRRNRRSRSGRNRRSRRGRNRRSGSLKGKRSRRTRRN